ncbi:MAG: 3-phosphoshikimate 1-carboxyvinyltransferase [Alistipes sp.]
MDQFVAAGHIRGAITPPCSKSYAQRALAAALLAPGRTVLHNVGFCDDTLSALRCIQTLGATVEQTDASTLIITGGFAPKGTTLEVGESALATRLFTPIAALYTQPIVIEGRGTLLHRSMALMAEPLRQLGVQVRDGGGFLPIEVCGPIHGGKIDVDASLSSQFLTGLLLALPATGEESLLYVSGAVSTPYLEITIDTARYFGVDITHQDYTEFFIPAGQHYQPADFTLEGDWSAAAMMLTAGALSGEVRIENISILSRQADTAICTALERAGAEIIIEQRAITVRTRPLHAFNFDATNCPDLFPALVALAAAAEGVSEITGTHRLEGKESNRAEVLKEEYEKFGIAIDLSQENIMRICGGSISAAIVSAHDDHRIAMSLAVTALRGNGTTTIEGAGCISKSYPTFFEELERIRA